MAFRALGHAISVMALLTASAGAASAQPSDQPRVYLGLRVGENPFGGAGDVVGLSLGADLGPRLSVELGADFYELRLGVPGLGTIGEYGVMALAPQVRLRYPVLGGRLAAYLVGGVGIAVAQFNDRKPPAFGLSVSAGDVTPAAVVGGGIEYYLADNVALGFEAKYVMAEGQSVTVQGTRHPVDLDTALFGVSLRLLYPEASPRPPVAPLPTAPARIYVAARIGGAYPVRHRVFPGVDRQAEAPAWGGILDQLFGVAVGLNLGRHLGVELPLEGYEMNLAVPGRGAVGEYAVYAAIPVLRLRIATPNGRLEPYVLGGVGLTYAEFNDGKPAGAGLDVQARDWAVGAAVGGGVEYFVTSNIAIGVEAKYLLARGHGLRIGGEPAQRGNLDTAFVSMGVRAFLGGIGQ